MDGSARAAHDAALRELGRDPGDVTVLDALNLGGPSAGLAFALEVVDATTPGDLTNGLTVAATGSLDAYGRVGPVGGIRYKTVAAERAGADLFLVPSANAGEAWTASTTIRVVPVDSLSEALALLNE